MNDSIIIRAFRAVDEPDTCELFHKGHTNVLHSYGVNGISSAKNEWFFNPEVYGLIAEYNSSIVGGVKIHKVGGTQPLPIEESIGYLDKGIFDIVKKYAPEGTGEACGLWNAREVAGKGISYILMRAMIAITWHIGINKLFSLSSDHTVRMCQELGYRIIHKLGDNGDFIYPTPRYIARVVLLNSKTLTWSTPYNKEIMLSLRERPIQMRKEKGPKGEMKIKYKLGLSA